MSGAFKIQAPLSFIDRTILIILKLAVNNCEEKSQGKGLFIIAGTRDRLGRSDIGGKLTPQAKQVESAEDFELITWLIIR